MNYTISLTGTVVITFMTFATGVINSLKNPVNSLLETLAITGLAGDICKACPEQPEDMEAEFECELSTESYEFVDKYCTEFFNALEDETKENPDFLRDEKDTQLVSSMEYLRKSLKSAVSTVAAES